MICLNWVPLHGLHSGAKRRAVELHARLPGRQFTAFVTGSFPEIDRARIPHAEFREVPQPRTVFGRLQVASRRWWGPRISRVPCSLWATEALPVPVDPHIPSVLTVHDFRYVVSPRYVSRRRFLLHRHRMRPALQGADRVVAVSEWTADELHRRFAIPREKIRVVPNGVDLALPDQVRDTTRPGSDPYLLTVGHLEVRKNVDTLVRAFAIVRQEWKGRLVVVGRDAGLRTRLQRLARSLGVDDVVSFVGAVDDREMLRLLRWCQALVCPSLYEGFGITLLEGFAFRKPVIASDIPPHREIGGNAAVWFDAARNAPEELADRVLSVLEHPTRAREIGEHGHARATLFTWEDAANRLDEVYRELDGSQF